MAVFEDTTGGIPNNNFAASYARQIGEPDHPVFGDTYDELLSATPATGNSHPVLCAISPEMQIIECMSGHGETTAILNVIQGHHERNY